MRDLYKSGRYFFAIAIIAFGVIQFITRNFMTGFLPVHNDLPGRTFFLYLVSTLFLAGGIMMFPSRTSRRISILIGILFMVFLVYPDLVRLFADLHNPGPWTDIAETLGLGGGAFMIAGDYSNGIAPTNNELLLLKLMRNGRVMLAIGLLIVAVQHFMYADFIGTLIPSWIPFPVFWAYFVGVAFAATCVSLLINIKTKLACILLGFMFLFWVIFLHGPRAFTNTHKEPEWSSLFIALGFSGVFFTIVGQYERKIVA
jgi:uncharacterized membrane protein